MTFCVVSAKSGSGIGINYYRKLKALAFVNRHYSDSPAIFRKLHRQLLLAIFPILKKISQSTFGLILPAENRFQKEQKISISIFIQFKMTQQMLAKIINTVVVELNRIERSFRQA